jgi:fanconi anemia group J protein
VNTALYLEVKRDVKPKISLPSAECTVAGQGGSSLLARADAATADDAALVSGLSPTSEIKVKAEDCARAGGEGDDDDDFAEPKRFRDARWQHEIGVRKQATDASTKQRKPEEQPENAHLPSQFDDLTRKVEDIDELDEFGQPITRRRVPRIFYASRTHAQITQVVAELRKSGYRPSMTVLASRNEYCQHPMVRRHGGKDEKCRAYVKAGSCSLFHRATAVVDAVRNGDQEPWDIEELNAIGKENVGCTYYASGELYKSAELVLCPYNYLIDPVVRDARSISVKGDIVILDEAHNIEDHAREAASFVSELAEMHRAKEEIVEMLASHRLGPPTSDVAVAHGQVVDLLKSVAFLGDSIVESGRLVPDGDTEVAAFQREELMAWMTKCSITIERVAGYKKALSVIAESKDEDYEKNPSRGFGGARRQPRSEPTNAGDSDGDDFDAGASFGRNGKRRRPVAGNARRLRGAESGGISDGDNEDDHAERRKSSGKGRPFALGVNIAERLVASLSFCLHNPESFALAVQRTTNQWVSSTEFHLWCLNPAIPFAALSKRARTVIVASGTLSPIDSFAGELGLNFTVAKSLPHVVNVKTQVFASVVAFGPGATKMDASYKGSMLFSFQDSLGEAIVDYCRVIPGGILIFFPSYRLLKSLSDRWKQSGTWAALEQVKGVVVCETNSRGGEFDDAMASYSEGALSDDGAVMMGVCRGKVSEGMDFKDASARAVLIIGIPYPNARSPQLLRKKAWNDYERQHSNRPELLTGSAWYDMQAFRALNQAIGRCVRHRRDYGAIVLLDARFRSPHVIKQLSGWVRGAMRPGDSTHNTTMAGLTDFFAHVEAAIPPV